MPLPTIADPISREELIAIRDGNKRNAGVRILLREIKRQHRLLMQIEDCRKAIDRAWHEATHSHLVGLGRLRMLLQPEIDRFDSDQ